ncbi:MAG: SPFH domain-containing protein [Gemmatimonadota bacterium]|nr:SPFH domain-containing protein [Gemmatimonadota bacterium]MDH3423521.1 SPFH domain-containing protein [Gemmatimonadota bacterium]
MGLFDKIKGEFIDVIEWTDDSADTLVYRFRRHNHEIKHGAQLTVREGQAAVFIDEGQLADVFPPGMYALETENLPILATLKGWKYGFESPFKAEVYFVSTRQFTDQKWGTKNPVTMRDPEFGPVRVRAFGTYAVRVSDPGVFIKEIVGTDGHFTTAEVTDQIRNILVARFSDAMASSGIPVLDMAANYDELGAKLDDRVRSDLASYGLELRTLLVENVSMPPAVEEALDKRTSMGVIGDLSAYTQYQAATAIGDAANSPDGGGMAAGGMGAGLGFAMASQIGQALNPPQQGAGQPTGAKPPPIPQGAQFYAAMDGKQTGPFGTEALKEQIRAGQVTKETLVWAEGMAEWAPASSVEAVAKLFGAVPPPLPPS